MFSVFCVPVRFAVFLFPQMVGDNRDYDQQQDQCYERVFWHVRSYEDVV